MLKGLFHLAFALFSICSFDEKKIFGVVARIIFLEIDAFKIIFLWSLKKIPHAFCYYYLKCTAYCLSLSVVFTVDSEVCQRH